MGCHGGTLCSCHFLADVGYWKISIGFGIGLILGHSVGEIVISWVYEHVIPHNTSPNDGTGPGSTRFAIVVGCCWPRPQYDMFLLVELAIAPSGGCAAPWRRAGSAGNWRRSKDWQRRTWQTPMPPGATLWLCQNSYCTWWFIVDLPIDSMVIFHSYAGLEEAKCFRTYVMLCIWRWVWLCFCIDRGPKNVPKWYHRKAWFIMIYPPVN